MAFQNVSHRLVTDAIAQIGQGTHNAVIPPRLVLAGHAYHEGLELLSNAGTSNRRARLAGVTLLGTQFPVPGEDRIRLRNRCDLFERFPTKFLTDLSEGLTVAIAQLHATVDLLAEDTVLGCEIGISQSEFFVNRLADGPQLFLPIHTSFHLSCHSLYRR
jgi:hypothetical protein